MARSEMSEFEKKYAEKLDKENSSPYFDMKFPNKRPSHKAMISLIAISFVLVFFVIIFSIITAVNNEKIETITVTINYYDGKTEDKILSKNDVFALPSTPDEEREGYRFVGWYLDENYETEYSTNSVIKNNTVIYAKWEKKKYTITFDVGPMSIAVEYGDSFTIPSNQSFGIVNLTGWTTTYGSRDVVYTEGDTITMPAKDIQLYHVNS